MFKMTESEAYRAVNEFINVDANYMIVSYGTQIKIQEALLKFNTTNKHTEEELYEHLMMVCPKFVEWLSKKN